MRNVSVTEIQNAVKELCIKDNKSLSEDIVCKICSCCECETNPTAKLVLRDLERNIEVCKSK